MTTIKQILITRDNLTPSEADSLIEEATTALYTYLEEDDQDSAEDVCMEYFNLESDYLTQLL